MITVRLPDHFPVRSTEWMLAAIKASWGVVLLAPADVFANPYLYALRQIAAQHVWGTIALVCGVAHLAALWVNGTRRRSPHLRALCSGIGAIFWLQVMLGIFATGLISPGWAIYPWLFVFSVYNVMRASSDAAVSDARARMAIGGA